MSGTQMTVAEQREAHTQLITAIKHEKFQAQIRASLPPSVSVDRFTAVTIAAINHNPDLLHPQIDRQSFYNSVVRAAQDGLLPDGNEAFLNIYSTNIAPRDQPPKWVKRVQYQKMVGGLIKIFENAGIDAWANSVYENDTFDVWGDDSGEHYLHRPARLGTPRGNRIGSYAVAKRPGARSIIIQVMDMDDLERVRNASKNPDKGPWRDWPERMEQKSALHRLKKRVAAADEKAAQHLNKVDDEFADDELQPTEQPTPAQNPVANATRPKVLQSIVDQESVEPAAAGDAALDGDADRRPGDII